MTGKGILVSILSIFSLASCNNRLIPDKPFLSKTTFKMDSLPESELSIPIQVNMKPLYQLAEKKVATLFTSPNWPEDWISIDCASRYKYRHEQAEQCRQGSGYRLFG